jgi:hypothetical protein
MRLMKKAAEERVGTPGLASTDGFENLVESSNVARAPAGRHRGVADLLKFVEALADLSVSFLVHLLKGAGCCFAVS